MRLTIVVVAAGQGGGELGITGSSLPPHGPVSACCAEVLCTRSASFALQMHRAKCWCIDIAQDRKPTVLKISLISFLSSANEGE